MTQKPTVLFINRVYPPAKGATGRVLRDLAQAFAKEGWDVTVLTTGRESGDSLDGSVRVIRKAARFKKNLLGYGGVWAKLLWAALRLPKHQVVVTLTDPPLLVVVGRMIARFKKSTHIHWCQDLYPDILPALGLTIPDWSMNVLRRVARRAMCSCDKVVVIGRCMARYLSHTGLDASKIAVIPNWPDFELTPAAKSVMTPTKTLPQMKGTAAGREILKSRPFFLDDAPKFRVLYSGNLGRAHPISTMIGAARILMDTNPEIEFVFVGEGDGFDKIGQERARLGLDNIRLLPSQPLSRLKDLMEGGDIHLISMKNEVAGMIVPSKLYAALAAGRPSIFIGPDTSETAKVITEFGAGSVVAQGQDKKLAETIRAYRDNGDLWFEAQKGALKASQHFFPSHSISSWIKGAKETIRSRAA